MQFHIFALPTRIEKTTRSTQWGFLSPQKAKKLKPKNSSTLHHLLTVAFLKHLLIGIGGTWWILTYLTHPQYRHLRVWALEKFLWKKGDLDYGNIHSGRNKDWLRAWKDKYNRFDVRSSIIEENAWFGFEKNVIRHKYAANAPTDRMWIHFSGIACS